MSSRLMRVATASFLVAVLAAPAAGADEIADKRAEAQRIASQLQAEASRVSELAEQYNAARLEAQQLEGRAAAAEADVSRLDTLLERAKRRVRAQAVEAYMHGGTSAQAGQLLDAGSGASDVTRRQQYVETILRSEREAITEMRQVRSELDERQAALDAARAQSRAALAAVADSRRSAAEAEAARRATLSRVQGELARLVDAETRRRAEDDARRAAADQAARRARDQAAAAPAAPRGTTPTTAAKGKSPSPAPAPAGPSAPPASGASAAVAKAKEQIGKPYEWGAEGPDSFDCSGLTLYAWRAGGRSLPHSSQAQYSATARVSTAALMPGDLLFYGSPIHHVGIYVGNGQMVEASETGTPVRYASIWRSDMVGAGRVY